MKERQASALVLPSDFASRGFKPSAELILTEAFKRGRISPREIAAFIPKEIARNRELMTSSVAWISNLMGSSNMGVMPDREAIHIVLPAKVKMIFPESSMGKSYISVDRKLSVPYTSKHTLLTEEEERDLGRRILEENDLEARNELVQRNLRLVWWIARKRLNRITGASIELEDLVQEGTLGLITGAERYDYRIGRFISYASWWIRQAIDRAIQNQKNLIRVPVSAQKISWEMTKAIRTFEQDNSREPTLEEISTISGLSTEMVYKLREAAERRILSLDQTHSMHTAKDDSEVSPGTLIRDESILPADIYIEAKEELRDARKAVNDTLGKLACRHMFSDRDRKIFEMFHGFDDSGHKRTLEQVGKQFQLSRERVRQIIARIWREINGADSDMDHNHFMEKLERIEQLEKIVASVDNP